MNDFIATLTRMHEANQSVQEEASKLAQTYRPPPPPPSSSSPSSSFSIPVDKLPKSVSFAGVDTQYSPKDPVVYYSLPSTPKKVRVSPLPLFPCLSSPLPFSFSHSLSLARSHTFPSSHSSPVSHLTFILAMNPFLYKGLTTKK